MEGFVKEPLSRRDLRRRREEKESKKDGGSKDTGRLEAVLTTPSPASYCIDPFPLVLQEAVGVSLPVETLRGEFLSLKRPSVTPGFDKKSVVVLRWHISVRLEGPKGPRDTRIRLNEDEGGRAFVKSWNFLASSAISFTSSFPFPWSLPSMFDVFRFHLGLTSVSINSCLFFGDDEDDF